MATVKAGDGIAIAQDADQVEISLTSGSATNGYVATADGAGGVDWKEAFLNSETINVTSARDLANSDANNILLASGTFDLTLPDSLNDDTIIMVIVTSGTVGIVAGAGSTLEGGDFDLDFTDGIAVATLLHTSAGQWYALWSAPAAPKPTVVDSGSSLTLDETHDGAIIEVADNADVDFADSLPSGWTVTIVRMGATAGTITRSTGHELLGPSGDAASYDIDNQYEAAAVYCRGSDSFLVVGPVS